MDEGYRVKNPYDHNPMGNTIITVSESQLKSFETRPKVTGTVIQTDDKKMEYKNIGDGYYIEKSSTAVSNNYGVETPPPVPFIKCRELYHSIPRVFNSAESLILDIRNRKHHYTKSETGNKKEDVDEATIEAAIKNMEDWDKEFKPRKQIFPPFLRNLLVCGVHIISEKDWLPMQLQKVVGKIRNDDGDTEQYIKLKDGNPEKIDSKGFIEIPYILEDREPWGLGKFHSIFFDDYHDNDGKHALSIGAMHRQSIQDTMRIHHKFASPRVFYNVEGVTKEDLNKDIVPIIESMKPGDRAAFNAVVTPQLETVDTTARFHESVINIQKEVDVGAGSAKNRLITEPSAMADAREATEADDDQILGLMEIIKDFMDMHVIPKVTGLPVGILEFQWGSKGTFRIEMPDYIKEGIANNIM